LSGETITPAPAKLSVDACRDSLSRPTTEATGGLDPANIRLVTWNIQKKNGPDWRIDFDALVRATDLLLIQEASPRTGAISALERPRYGSFAPGYARAGEVTGVLTLSTVKPITRCSFVSLEPVLHTPKATNITQYALNATDATIVVVNVHAVNFSLGLAAFRGQFRRIGEVLSEHRGPIIVAGDFNTWRAARMDVVEQLAARLDLEPLQFDQDHRVRFLGHPLDHIYVRGLSTAATSTLIVKTSDHNPMSATLGM
jgi:endonuclease/exonuclease/phosphatase (EEP) superfamily protein YafD